MWLYLVCERGHDPHHDVLALFPGERLEARDETHEVLEDVAHVVGQSPQRGLDVVAVYHHVSDAVLRLSGILGRIGGQTWFIQLAYQKSASIIGGSQLAKPSFTDMSKKTKARLCDILYVLTDSGKESHSCAYQLVSPSSALNKG